MTSCIKEAYASRGEATKAAYHAGIYAEAYCCTLCKQWHLTSGASRKKAHYKRTRSRGGKRYDKKGVYS